MKKVVSVESRVLFPLRSNARSLLAGKAASGVRRRIKLAALLSDRLLIEEGVRDISAGSGGSTAFWQPANTPDGARWQTTHERKKATGGIASIVAKLSTAPPDQPGRRMLQFSPLIAWRATFEPLKDELTGYPWVEFDRVDDSGEAKRLVRRLVQVENRDPKLQEILPDSFVRKLVVEHANLDLAQATEFGAAASMDQFYASLIRARAARGEAHAVLGPDALEIVLPDAGTLDWPDIDEWRRHPGVGMYRDVLREIEAAARDSAASLDDLRFRVHREYESWLHKARLEIEGSLGSRLTKAANWLVVGELLPPVLSLPHIPGLLTAAASFAVDELRARFGKTRWTAADDDLRYRIGRKRQSGG